MASIEPRSFKRGNLLILVVAFALVAALQLSHVHSNVETLPKDADRALGESELQLSHVHSNVETVELRGQERLLRLASIEPRSFKRGNP